MKRLLLFTLVALGISSNQLAIAQAFTAPQDTIYGYATESFTIKTKLTNTSGSSLKISWMLDDYSTPANWMISGVCDNSQCHPFSNVTGNQVKEASPIDAGAQLETYVDFNAAAAATGKSWATVKYWTKADQSDAKSVTYIATKVATNVNNVSKVDDNVTLYPNPAKENVNVIFPQNAGVKNIAVYNMIGKVVSVYKVVGNSAKLDIDNIPSGIYFVRLLDAQGHIVATRKFTHQ